VPPGDSPPAPDCRRRDAILVKTCILAAADDDGDRKTVYDGDSGPEPEPYRDIKGLLGDNGRAAVCARGVASESSTSRGATIDKEAMDFRLRKFEDVEVWDGCIVLGGDTGDAVL
jgi:hypothetical protein